MKPDLLSTELALAVSAQIVDLGEEIYRNKSHLASSQFLAHSAKSSFDESFAANAEEVTLHRRFRVEFVKQKLGSAEQRGAMLPRSTYRSQFLRSHQEDIESRYGLSIPDILKKFPGEAWRTKLDPCNSNAMRLARQDPSEYARRVALFEGEKSKLFEQDKRIHIRSDGSIHAQYGDDRSGFFRDFMEEAFGPLGFDLCGSWPKTMAPLFAKSIRNGWHLAWVPDVALFERNLAITFELTLLLLPSASMGKNLRPGMFLEIPFGLLAEGFIPAYRRSRTLDDVALDIMANAALYRIVAPDMERRLCDGLERPACSTLG